jgi:hypothetical protein
MAKRITTEDFISRSRAVHGNKYDYSKTAYVLSSEKLTITCRKHGAFQQRAADHLKGKGCGKCAGNHALTTAEYVAQARAVHGDRYDYAATRYSACSAKVTITCPRHGPFQQKAGHHVNSGSGCPSCATLTTAEGKMASTADFIRKAIAVHGDKYDYSGAEYIGALREVTIICMTHGPFKQIAANHTHHACGCPSCAEYGFDRAKHGHIYLLRSDCGRYAKVGISHDPKQRHSRLKCVTPFGFRAVEVLRGPGAKVAEVERTILDATTPVNFATTFDGSTEWRLWDEKIRTSLLRLMGVKLADN